MLSASQCYPLHSQCSTVILSNSGADSAAFLTCFSCTAAVLQIEHELALWTGVADDELEDLNCGTELWHFFSGLAQTDLKAKIRCYFGQWLASQVAAPPILTSSGPLLFTAADMASNKT